MKLSVLQHNCNNRRTNSFRTTNPLDSSSLDPNSKSPSTLFWLILHCLCCLISLVLGFRFSRLLLYLLLSSSTTTPYTAPPLFQTTTTTTTNAETTLAFQKPPSISNFDTQTNHTSSRVVVGRHGILIRPWPHPNPTEVMKAHRIIDRVQKEQKIQYGIKNPKTLIMITPTYVRTFQTIHLTGLIHSLMLVPYDLIWIVVEAGGTSNETANLLSNSGLRTIHIGFEEKMPISWEDRHRMEARMRLRALRVVREERLDGIVMFADDSNMHSMELFDEIQSVKWIGAVSVGILAHSGNSEEQFSLPKKQEDEENLPMPVQGPACNSSGQLAGWHTFNSLPYAEKSATYIGDGATVLPKKLEWAGFVMNSRLVWQEIEDKPEWVRDLDTLAEDVEALDSPLSLLKDASFVEPLGNCGRKIMLWWLRVEARADSKFPSRWIIDPPLEITVPAKRTPWPDAPPEIPSDEKVNGIQEHTDKRPLKIGRSSRSRHGPRNKRKHEPRIVDTHGSGRRAEEK
ncbi:Glycosyl transferase [Macleaya cordata]|uniref:Glycosyltransferases n=1 Tax=Macleaya cordata TaxID=56857 RepID=A0A200QZJ2_MACCD|nr:Glycosyl transferase [Macleaya cordata]